MYFNANFVASFSEQAYLAAGVDWFREKKRKINEKTSDWDESVRLGTMTRRFTVRKNGYKVQIMLFEIK